MLIYCDPLGKSWFCNSSQVYCSQLYGMYIIKVSIVSSHVFIVLVYTTFDETWSLKHMNNPITPTSKYKQHPWGLDPWNDPRFRANIWTHVTHATSQPLAALHNEARNIYLFWNSYLTYLQCNKNCHFLSPRTQSFADIIYRWSQMQL